MKVIAFDLDDTLYKEIEYVKSGYRAVAHELGDDSLYDVMISAYNAGKNPFDAVVEKCVGADVSKMVDTYRAHRPDIQLPRATRIVLDYLHGKYKLAVITDGRSVGQRNKIEALGVNAYVNDDDIIISEEFGSDKHSAENFRVLMERYSEADKFFYVGDNPEKDFYQPGLLGWTTIQLDDIAGVNIFRQDEVPDEAHLPQYRVEQLWDIVPIIEEYT